MISQSSGFIFENDHLHGSVLRKPSPQPSPAKTLITLKKLLARERGLIDCLSRENTHNTKKTPSAEEGVNPGSFKIDASN